MQAIKVILTVANIAFGAIMFYTWGTSESGYTKNCIGLMSAALFADALVMWI